MSVAESTKLRSDEYLVYIFYRARIQSFIVFDLVIGRRCQIRLNSKRESYNKQSSA